MQGPSEAWIELPDRPFAATDYRCCEHPSLNSLEKCFFFQLKGLVFDFGFFPDFFYPIRQKTFEFHGVQYNSAGNAERNSRSNVNCRRFQAERSEQNGATATSLTSGDVTRKAKVTPSGMPPLTKPINNGTDEPEQNGVIAPKAEANGYSSP
jgi:hypothetical protein